MNVYNVKYNALIVYFKRTYAQNVEEIIDL